MKLQFPKTKRTIIVSFLILGVALSIIVGYWYGNSQQDVVATVNGENISKNELYELLVKQNGQQVLDSLISQKIIEFEAKKQNIVISDEDIQKELAKFHQSYGSEDAFNQALEMSGYSLDDIKKELTLNIKINKLLEPRISITEEEIKKYFDENKEQFAQQKQVKASHILVETEEKANEIKKKLSDGQDFAQLAKDNSTDTMSKENGGDLGFFGSGDMVAEFEKAAFALEVGEISSPVKSEFGYHIIKVTEVKEAQEANYEESKLQIKDTLFGQKAQTEYSTWLQELYEEYKIENFLEDK
ncbi:peptidylprolyl isomerase [Phosphitispora sp. TUW77]|uniref:peptidylprolyl isomerase n=1 Tax=Phosphitispora sp. TUW77 TaxID=3152361 RepID=UPI003AB657E7